MKKMITLVCFIATQTVMADVYEANFSKQIENIKKQASTLIKEVEVQKVGIEDLEAMRQRVDG